MRDAQAGVPSTGWLRAQLAFKNSMVHGILQFTPSIAFCYVLHRCVSRDIRCRESLLFLRRLPPACTPQNGAKSSRCLLLFHFPWHMPRRGLLWSSATSMVPQKRYHRNTPDGVADQNLRPITTAPSCIYMFTGRSALQGSTMILPQVHLRKPCYDFSFL